MQQEFDWAVQNGEPVAWQQLPPAGRLFFAIQNDDVRLAEAVLSEGFVPYDYWIGGKSFLRHAGEQGRRAICEALVRFGADPNEANGKRNYALLHRAVASGNYGFASILLDLGAVPSPLTSNNATPLHFAARSGLEYLARKLLQHGADINFQDTKGRSPLLLAFEKSHMGIAKLLIKYNGDLSLPDNSGLTPRMVAEQLGEACSEFLPD